jgi:hypothetical protein
MERPMKRKIAEVSTPALVAEITTLAGHLNAANARFRADCGARPEKRLG